MCELKGETPQEGINCEQSGDRTRHGGQMAAKGPLSARSRVLLQQRRRRAEDGTALDPWLVSACGDHMAHYWGDPAEAHQGGRWGMGGEGGGRSPVRRRRLPRRLRLVQKFNMSILWSTCAETIQRKILTLSWRCSHTTTDAKYGPKE